MIVLGPLFVDLVEASSGYSKVFKDSKIDFTLTGNILGGEGRFYLVVKSWHEYRVFFFLLFLNEEVSTCDNSLGQE